MSLKLNNIDDLTFENNDERKLTKVTIYINSQNPHETFDQINLVEIEMIKDCLGDLNEISKASVVADSLRKSVCKEFLMLRIDIPEYYAHFVSD